MRTERAHSLRLGVVDTSVVWLLSFGDLLTLLACSFLVLTPHLASVEGNRPRKEQLSSYISSEEPHGTVLANLEGDGSALQKESGVSVAPVLLIISAASRGSQAKELAELESELEGMRDKVAGEHGVFRVRVCRNNYSSQRVKDLYRMISSIQGSEGGVELELMSKCEVDRKNTADVSNLVAVVTFSRS